jgi:dTDP-4-amino-4,6-dideoxygalactose transaminase
MSEYQAAVGLAFLDNWDTLTGQRMSVSEQYHTCLSGCDLGRLVTQPQIGSTYTLFDCRTSDIAKDLTRRLAENDVPHRFWYSSGLSGHYAFESGYFEPSPVTQDISVKHIGLPTMPDLDKAVITAISELILNSSACQGD